MPLSAHRGAKACFCAPACRSMSLGAVLGIGAVLLLALGFWALCLTLVLKSSLSVQL